MAEVGLDAEISHPDRAIPLLSQSDVSRRSADLAWMDDAVRKLASARRAVGNVGWDFNHRHPVRRAAMGDQPWKRLSPVQEATRKMVGQKKDGVGAQ